MSTALLVEKLGGSSVAADLHESQLGPVPRVEVGGSNKGDVYAHVAVHGRAVETDVDGIGRRCPGWVLGSTVEAYLSYGCRERERDANDWQLGQKLAHRDRSVGWIRTLFPFCVALSDLKISTSSSLEGPSAMVGYSSQALKSSDRSAVELFAVGLRMPLDPEVERKWERYDEATLLRETRCDGDDEKESRFELSELGPCQE